jgi:hypothetical protein
MCRDFRWHQRFLSYYPELWGPIHNGVLPVARRNYSRECLFKLVGLNTRKMKISPKTGHGTTAIILPWEHAKIQPTNWIIPSVPHHHLAKNNRQEWVYICGEFSCPLDFFKMFHSYVAIFFQFIIYGPTMGRAKTKPTNWVWCHAPHHRLANNNRQGWVYFCGEFSCPWHNLLMLNYCVSKRKFNLSAMVLPRDSQNSDHRLSLASRPTPPPSQH